MCKENGREKVEYEKYEDDETYVSIGSWMGGPASLLPS